MTPTTPAPPSPPRPPGGRVARALSFGVLAYLLLSLVGTVVLLSRNTARRIQFRTDSAPADLSPRAEAFTVTTRDGVRIEGFLAPPVADAPVVIVQHGRGRTRDNVLPWARVLAGAGYGVAAFDWRSHGESEGDVIHLGAREPADLAAVLELLAARPDTGGRPVGVMAASMGAAITALSAPEYPDTVRCLILDSPFGDLGRMAGGRVAFLGPLRAGPDLWMPVVTSLFLGRPATDIRPEESLAAFAPRPVLVMHGERDTIIPVREGRSLHDAYPGEKRLWITDTAHCAARVEQTREFMEQVATFLHEHLPGAPAPERVLALTPERLEHGDADTGLRTMRTALPDAALLRGSLAAMAAP